MLRDRRVEAAPPSVFAPGARAGCGLTLGASVESTGVRNAAPATASGDPLGDLRVPTPRGSSRSGVARVTEQPGMPIEPALFERVIKI